ncbi:hypothetical protein LTR16_003568 [Cryomyces antarcticus]|uniref:Methyltransferase domain-containing protein n=1 Tax=Cryomyces antarcticus TaxID=329879 RepID=A0ABR0KSI0_9PEZI|nr:hypothetical protein LTR39_002516 [Cryomyces antarcticus]KAK5017948.1 hypothetical protein LTR60_001712 [Cryomyces antarcticus]KAK5124333.1 hypothetical protein LTR16_003568 [Cryomyces antarcticus]
MSSLTIPSQALSGFADGASYDQHRPSFPAESVNNLLDKVGIAGVEGARVLDLAAGTGKFTELLAKREEGYEVLAVEPHEGMRRVLEEKRLENVLVEDGLSTSIPLGDESVDAVIAAQLTWKG